MQQTFCDAFDNIAQKIPHEKAVIYNQKFLTYAELSEISNNIARQIALKGIRANDIVALSIYNDLDLIPIILGIWKAGGVYLPIDPNYPLKRIKQMLNDCYPKMIITKNELIKRFSFFTETILVIDDKLIMHHEGIVEKPSSNDLAYIMYTSGSTGKPKGIRVKHSSLLHAAVAYYELHPEKHIALVSGSISFDPSLLTIVYSLISRGTLCLFNNRSGVDIKNVEKVVQLIQKNAISFLLSTPSFYFRILNKKIPLISLRNVDLCGEIVTEKVLDFHSKFAQNAYLYNAYGPTEYAIGVTAGLLYNPVSKTKYDISIGKPFSSNKVYLLNSDFHLVQSEENGEIFVGGPGLAEGYVNLEKQTKEKFLVFSNIENKPIRLYRTGDFGYYNSNGDLIFIGRKDSQIKINGHRVELAEIEYVINTHPEIEKAVVLVETVNEINQIVVFFTSLRKMTKVKLNKYLSMRLPRYMIPSGYVQIQDWPITNNGKIDKLSLIQIYRKNQFKNA